MLVLRRVENPFFINGILTTITPPNFNMEPENDGFQQESPNFHGLLTSGSWG